MGRIATSPYKLLPASSRQRGLAAIGLELSSPVDVIPIDAGSTVVRCVESGVGELSVELFKAALIIDRDGILAEKVVTACAHEPGRATPPIAVTLPGASGFRASIELDHKAPLRFVYVFAIAPHDLGVDGGALVTVRSASREWPTANEILKSLRVFGRRAATANDGPVLSLVPIVGSDE
ncbi:MAG: hypothetical protein QM831_17135 [Kofleriaceae bacterium]